MTAISFPPWIRAAARRQTWLRMGVYGLAIFGTFSIAGIETAIVVLYGAALVHCLRASKPGPEPLPRWLVASFFLLPLAALVSALVNGQEATTATVGAIPHRLGNLLELRGFYRVLLPLALVPALGLVRRRHLLLTLLVCVGLMALYATVQFRWGVDWLRPEGRKLITPYTLAPGFYHGNGNFSQHLTFAGVMLMPALLFLSLARESADRLCAAWIAGAALAALGVLVSLSRAGWAGLAVGACLLLLHFPRRVLAPLLLAVALFGGTAAVMGSGWLKEMAATPGRSAVVTRLLSASWEQNQDRLYLWESALMGIRDRPWFGVGYGNDAVYVPPYRLDLIARKQARFFVGLNSHMHNVFLQVAFELGLVGLAAYLAWWGAILRWNRLWLRRAGAGFACERAVLYGASAGLVGSMAAGLFENNFFDGEVQAMVLLLMGLSLHAGLRVRDGLAALERER